MEFNEIVPKRFLCKPIDRAVRIRFIKVKGNTILKIYLGKDVEKFTTKCRVKLFCSYEDGRVLLIKECKDDCGYMLSTLNRANSQKKVRKIELTWTSDSPDADEYTTRTVKFDYYDDGIRIFTNQRLNK